MFKEYFNNSTISQFIEENWHEDITKLALKLSKTDLPKDYILNQINGKQKAKQKLPTWFENNKLIYPKKISVEQASSEETAKFKASLIQGKTLVDLTGGFGVDDYYFSQQFEKVFHCELSQELSEIVNHNVNVLGVDNLKCIHGDSLEFLKTVEKVDAVFVDPARRNDVNEKVFRFQDCLPNIVENIDLLFSKTSQILVKASPMVDISQGVEELQYVKKVFVIAVRNECKEILFLLEKKHQGTFEIECVELFPTVQKYAFSVEEEKQLSISFSQPKQYLYEPNTSILKGGAFKSITTCGITKLGINSHLYTSENLVEDFMGRSFEIQEVCAFSKKEFAKKVGKKANITVRNFPYSVQEIRKKTKVKDGGDLYVFCTTNYEEKPIVIICQKLKKLP
ncbi:MAG: class I SAM-dependent methyltransferase [Cytophagales bacterium]|nr:class I SAM-dependent methyltransferase [Cytophagales bacterium]